MNATIIIAASEAKAKFSEFLKRARNGEEFDITLRGEKVARLIPAQRLSLSEIQSAISETKAGRITLNPPGKLKLKIKDLIDEGRP